MNTLIHLWIEPLVIGHKRSNDKLYFNCIIDGEHLVEDDDQMYKLVEGNILYEIMDFSDIQENWNFHVLWTRLTNKETSITQVSSPEEKKEQKITRTIKKELTKVLAGDEDIKLDNKSVLIEDNGKISISLPALRIKEEIDFPKLWEILEKNIIGKMTEGDVMEFNDLEGNEIMRITGGSFLNVGIADLMIKNKGSIIGGLFIRENGKLAIGDIERTFYMEIETSKLLKASLKLNKSLNSITEQKLLTFQK